MKKIHIPTTAIAAILSITGAAYADITVTQRITMDGVPEMAGGGPAPAPAPKPPARPVFTGSALYPMPISPDDPGPDAAEDKPTEERPIR